MDSADGGSTPAGVERFLGRSSMRRPLVEDSYQTVGVMGVSFREFLKNRCWRESSPDRRACRTFMNFIRIFASAIYERFANLLI